MRCKKLYGVKRFKEVALERADLEVKTDGVEILRLGEDVYGKVLGWQYIDRFAAIDFDKPGRGMQIGMMPAKLAQMLVNIWVWLIGDYPHPNPLPKGEGERLGSGDEDSITVWDPFCGFGTTLFVANSLRYHAIGSDINSTLAKKNIAWWPTTEYAHEDRYLTLFKHDVLEPFTKWFLQAVDVIVTEGWLGPVVKSSNADNRGQHALILKNIEDIVAVYRGFLDNAKNGLTWVPIVMTVPVYDRLGDVIEQRITKFAKGIGYHVESVGEVYQREKQVVGRRVLVLKSKE